MATGPHTQGDYQLQISSTFSPNFKISHNPPDLILRSLDNVYFYVHTLLILASSTNAFAGYIPSSKPSVDPGTLSLVQVAEPSEVLNIILHAIYDMDPAHFSPSMQTLRQAIDQFPRYGLNPIDYITPSRPLYNHLDYTSPSKPLYNLLLARAPTSALEVYTLAGHHNLEELAIATSSHLLGVPLYQITDELAAKMGWRYLFRLLRLHTDRVEALKRILLILPPFHKPTPFCGKAEQQKFASNWSAAHATLCWEVRSDLSVAVIESILKPVIALCSCLRCKESFENHIRSLAEQWMMVPSTI